MTVHPGRRRQVGCAPNRIGFGGGRVSRLPHPHLHPWRVGFGWLRVLDEDNVQAVVLNRTEDRRLLRLLRRSGAWVVDFADCESAILVRRETGMDVLQS